MNDVLIAKEDIPDDESVSRWHFQPSGVYNEIRELIWTEILQFPTSDGGRESLVWRRYAETIDQVHALGCELERGRQAAGIIREYRGAFSANVGLIRALRNKNGHGFSVVHHPEKDAPYHTHIYFDPVAGYVGQTIPKPEKNDLKFSLGNLLSQQFDDHACP